MIIGIGIDIVEIKRIEEAVQKWGSRFLNRIYTEREISHCYLKKTPFIHLAGRFAAKEAAIKAFSGAKKQALNKETLSKFTKNRPPSLLTDLSFTNKTPSFREIEILNDDSGIPYIIINTPYCDTKKLNSFSIHLSLSHEKSYAVATVIIELKDY